MPTTIFDIVFIYNVFKIIVYKGPEIPCLRIITKCVSIKTTATTGKIGDGKIFILDIQEAIRVRTGEKGSKAL